MKKITQDEFEKMIGDGWRWLEGDGIEDAEMEEKVAMLRAIFIAGSEKLNTPEKAKKAAKKMGLIKGE